MNDKYDKKKLIEEFSVFKRPKVPTKNNARGEKKEPKKEEIAKEVNNVKDLDFSNDEHHKKKHEHKKKKKHDDGINVDFGDLKITQIETDKNKIFQRYLMQHDLIPKHPGVSIFVGGVGSGKSTLCNNLLVKPQYYGKSLEGVKDGKPKPYFDTIFLFTGSDDDLYQDLIDLGILEETHINYNPTAEHIKMILDAQRKTIDEKGLLEAPKTLVILEDIVDNQKLLRSDAFKSLFVKPRQHGLSVWLLSQYLKLIPKSCRLQAMNLFLFRQERTGQELLCEQYCPATMKKDEFMKVIEFATSPDEESPNPFLHINQRVKNKNEKFRRNLDRIILIDKKN